MSYLCDFQAQCEDNSDEELCGDYNVLHLYENKFNGFSIIW